MDETKLIELYKEGMDAIISSIKSMHTELKVGLFVTKTTMFLFYAIL